MLWLLRALSGDEVTEQIRADCRLMDGNVDARTLAA